MGFGVKSDASCGPRMLGLSRGCVSQDGSSKRCEASSGALWGPASASLISAFFSNINAV